MKTPIDYNVNNSRLFQSIKARVEKSLINCFGLSHIDQIDQICPSRLLDPAIDLRRDIELTLFIDNCLSQLLASLDIRSDFMQFPANIRLLHPHQDLSYLKRDFNVDTIHCDHWSGAPEDSHNFYLYVRKPVESPCLIHYKLPMHQEQLMKRYRGSHISAPKLDYIPIANNPFEGLLQSFQCDVPHKIQREGLGVLISIDFRIRNLSPIFDFDLAQRPLESWVGSKMTSLGVYWKTSSNWHDSLYQKIQAELSSAIKFHGNYFAIRAEYLRRYYDVSSSNIALFRMLPVPCHKLSDDTQATHT